MLRRIRRFTRDDVAPSGEADSGLKYGALWSPSTVPEAHDLIVTYVDQERFERTGQEDVEARIAPFVDSDSVVVDLGCGMGRIARYAAPLVRTLWYVDASPRMLELAAERLSGLTNVRPALCHDTSVPQIPSGSVDFVYSIITLQHMDKEDAFLLMRDVVRMLVPGGRAAITFPNILDPEYLEAFITCAEGGRAAIDNQARPRFWTLPEVELIAKAAGFVEVDVWDGPNLTAICTAAGD